VSRGKLVPNVAVKTVKPWMEKISYFFEIIVNPRLRKMVGFLSPFMMVLGILIGAGYFCLTFPSWIGLAIGLALASLNTLPMVINWAFTWKSTGVHSENNSDPSQAKIKYIHTYTSLAFLAGISLTLVAGGIFTAVGSINGTLLLAAGLAATCALTINPVGILVFAVVVAVTMAISAFIWSWLQVYGLSQKFQEEVVVIDERTPYSAPDHLVSFIEHQKTKNADFIFLYQEENDSAATSFFNTHISGKDILKPDILPLDSSAESYQHSF
jgi:hypothetical protein